jgi:Ulp1 family protease
MKNGTACANNVQQRLKIALELPSNWSINTSTTVPLQRNGVDCGIFCAQFMKFEYFGDAIPDWCSADIQKLRQMMVLELYEMKLRRRLP